MSFTYQDKQFVCERVAVAEIAAQVGTPFYLYSSSETSWRISTPS